ncbi:MAG: M1 family aminopeptidase [Gemmatimonadota bacterium]
MRASVFRLLLASLAVTHAAQARPPRPIHRAAPAVADAFLPRYTEARELKPAEGQVATVKGLEIDRDAGRFMLTSGSMTLLTPVGGQTVAAVFHGKGSFTLVPPGRIEKDRLSRFEKHDSLSDTFSDVMFLFTDSTLAELQGKLKFGPGPGVDNAGSTIKSTLNYLSDDSRKSFYPDLMADFLNGAHSGVFCAYINRDNGGSLMYLFNPRDLEAVQLWGSTSRGLYSRAAEGITQFPARGFVPDSIDLTDHGREAFIRAYRIEAWMPQTGGAGLGFSAAAHLEMAADLPRGPWVAFGLQYKLEVDSARLESGEALQAFKGHEDDVLWLRLPAALEPGKSVPMTVYYHGALIDRFGEFFGVDPSSDWYPRSLAGRSLATFDLTFHSPQWLQLACVGNRVDSTAANRMSTTHWVTDAPIRNAQFNIGNFKAFHAQEAGSPPVTVLISEDAHRTSEGGGGHQKNMKEQVGADVTGALKFFDFAYGPVQAKDFIATEIPYGEGVAFPGLIDLSAVTFQETGKQGEDQIFRAHEVAHQWWGIGVDFTSYHDQWISEGFSEFSGLWYMQTVLHDNTKYFAALDRWRTSFLLHRDQRTPISLGGRVGNSKDELGYQDIVYYKGAWVLHMLRTMMLDLKTMNEDRFTGMMRQFYSDHVGRRASTADFQKAVEQASGVPMDWFFNQWVDGYQIPTYKVATMTDGADGQYRVHLKVTQEDVPDSFLMYVPVSVDLGDKKIARFRVKVTGHQTVIDLPPLPLKPQNVKFNDLDGVLADVKSVAW